MELKDVAADYFSKINSIANRMCVDMNETRAAYDDLWLTLSEDEQVQILNESIIKPEICLKYADSDVEDKNKNEYAVKLIIDDNYSYRDEHSAPFSFRTPSQRNLSVFSKQHSDNGRKVLNISKNKDALKMLPHKASSINTKSKEVASAPLIELEIEDDALVSFSDVSPLSHIPKTGLDLLDNW